MKRVAHASFVLVAALFVSANAARAQDPGVAGPLAVTMTGYDFGDTAFTPVGFPGPVELRARVHHPTNLSAGPFPLVVFLHGRHFTCSDGTGPGGGWPCAAPTPTPIPSFQGYDYISQILASYGYVVISISANGINAVDNATADRGAQARAELIQRHLELWRSFNTTGAAPFGTTFVGRVDLNNIGTMGHSRGGEGVVRHFGFNQSQGSPFGIRAVLPLAPTDFSRFVANRVPLAVILPYCDGDLDDLQGVHYYDDARYNVAGDLTRKHTFLVHGANHNYFNTIWTPETFPVGSSDDSLNVGLGADPHCAPTAPSRLNPTQQRSVGRAYIAGFFRAYLGRETQFLPFLTGEDPPPPSVQTSAVFASYHAPDSPLQRRDVNRFLTNSNLTTNTLGGAVTRSGLVPQQMCGGAELAQPTQCLPAESTSRQPHTTPSFLAPAARGLAQLSLGWNSTTANIVNALPAGSRDARGFETIQFRASVNFADARNGGLPRDLSVVLTDGLGRTASQRVSDHSAALYFPPGNTSSVPKLFNNTVQLPLSAFTGINMADIRSVTLRFNRQATGALTITDLAFSNPIGARVMLNAIVGEATTLPFPAGQMHMTATFTAPYAVDLSRAHLTFFGLLQQGQTELVRDVPMPLQPLPGATPLVATFVSLLVPGVTVVVTNLGFNIYGISMTVFNEAITQPSTCGLLGGTAQLTTRLAIEDGANPPVVAADTRTWFCTPPGGAIFTP